MSTQVLDPGIEYQDLIALFDLEPLTVEQKVRREAINLFFAEESDTTPLWQPNPDSLDGSPNPQRLALESEADILGYGGAGGGGKTDLLLGLALTQHRKSVIFRRVYPNLKEIISRSVEIVDGDDKYNKTEKVWRLENKVIEFGAIQYENDKKSWQGRPHDFYGFDEVTEFTRSQVEFVTSWNRTTIPGQRCRVVMTFNPPIDDSGSWVIDYFLPWLAYLYPNEFTHPNPAEPGELRWYATIDGKEVECENGEPFTSDSGEKILPRSRTFIPARLTDNPHLAETSYAAVLQSLPEPLRSKLLYGDFSASMEPDPWQVIPTSWVKLAQKRWMEREKPDMPLSGTGVDVARGGGDKLVVSKRYGTWFDEPAITPGVNVEDGPKAAGILYQNLEKEKNIGYINLDVIGIGSSAYDSAKVIFPDLVIPVNAAASSDYVVKAQNGQVLLKMKNIRAEYHWRLREALDPEHGDDLALPPGNEIVADLCAARYEVQAGGVIQIEKKEKIKERIGRSPDIGEAIMLANASGLGKPKWRKISYLGV